MISLVKDILNLWRSKIC